jgi:hypothetical protein
MSIEWQPHQSHWPPDMRVGIERGFFGRRVATILDDPRTGWRWRKQDEQGDRPDLQGRWFKVAPLDTLPREAVS